MRQRGKKVIEKDTRTAPSPPEGTPRLDPPGTRKIQMTEEERAEGIKLLKFLKALNHPIRRTIVEFILNYKKGDEITVTHKGRER